MDMENGNGHEWKFNKKMHLIHQINLKLNIDKLPIWNFQTSICKLSYFDNSIVDP
jgi:hypothetical protein